MSSIAHSQSRTFVLQQQADHLVQQIIQGRDTATHTWILTQLRITYPAIGASISTRTRAMLPHASDPCVPAALSGTDPVKAMGDVWRCVGDPDLGVLYASLLPAEERRSLPSRFPNEWRRIMAEPVTAAYWMRLTSDVVWSEILLSPRPFRASDHLLIPGGYGYSDNHADALNRIVDRWQADIPPSRRNLDMDEAIRVFWILDRHFQHNEYAKMVAYIPVLSRQATVPDVEWKLRTFRRLAFAAYSLGQYQSALDFYRSDLLPLVNRMASAQPTFTEPRLRVEIDYGNILFRLGDIRGARDVYAGVFPHRDQLSERRFRSALLNNLAVTYLNSGMTDEYLDLQLEALSEAKAIEQWNNQLQILNNLYVFHWRRGDWENAVRYLREALIVATRTGDPNERASILTLYATYHREYLNEYETSLRYSDQAIEVVRNGGNRPTELFAQFEKAVTLQAMGRFAEATHLYGNLITESEAANDRTSALQNRIRLAWTYHRSGQLERADAVIREIENQREKAALSFDYEVSLVTLLANRRLREGRVDLAIARIKPVVDALFDRLENSADAQTGFIRMSDEHVLAIRTLTDLHLRNQDFTAAAALLDLVKSVNQATLANSNLVKSERLSESDRLADYQAGLEMESIRSELLVAAETERLDLNNRLLALQQQRNQRIRASVSGYRYRPDIEAIRKELRRKEMAISITILDGVVYRTILTRSSVAVDRLESRPDQLAFWTQVMGNVHLGRTNLIELHALGRDVFGDIWQSGSYPERLVFVPDGPLHRIPIEIIPIQAPSGPNSYGSTTYLLEKTAIRYAASLTELTFTPAPHRRIEHDFLGVGISRLRSFPRLSPLPNAESEIESIARRFGPAERHRTLTGASATESQVRAMAPQSRVLHIASHSEINSTDPLFSVIYLEADSLHDGALYAFEWFSLPLANDLVMLSSCESAGGAYIQGSGMVGLARALRIAGARSMIVNTWSVQDHAAAEISQWFYEGMHQGMAYDEALRQAKIRFIQTRSADPNRWGSFILIGEAATLETAISIRTWLLVGGVLMLIALWVLIKAWGRQRLSWDTIR